MCMYVYEYNRLLGKPPLLEPSLSCANQGKLPPQQACRSQGPEAGQPFAPRRIAGSMI